MYKGMNVLKWSKFRSKVVNLILTAVFLFSAIVPANAWAYTITSEGRYEEQIAEGVQIETITQYTDEGTLKIYVMEVDLSNKYLEVDTLIGNGDKLTGAAPVTEMVTNSGAVAGVNGDFFQMNEKAPLGLTVKEGEIISSPAQREDLYGFALDMDKVPMIKIFDFEGQVQAENGQTYPLYGINKPTYLDVYGNDSDINTLNLYTPRWGEKSRGKLPNLSGVMEVVVEGDNVKEIRTDSPGVVIPQNGYVLSAHGKAADWVKANVPLGSKVSTEYHILPDGEKLASAIGGQAMIVNYGKRSWFTQNIKGKKARTAIGYTKDRNTMFLVVVEGGSSSRGMTQEELADFMASLGCWQAINIDGGGSSTMAARLLGEEEIDLINRPVYTVQRHVPDAIGIFSTAPKGDYEGLKIRGERFVLAGTSRAYTAKGYDEHYNPYHIDPEQVSWEIEPQLGSFEGNILTADKRGKAIVTAGAKGKSETFDIQIFGAEDIGKIEILPSAVELHESESVNLKVRVTAKNGVVFNLNGQEVDWQVSKDIGTVADGKFTAVDKQAVGELTAVIDGMKVSIPVSIGSVEKAYSGLEVFNNYHFSGLPAQVTGDFKAAALESVFHGTGTARLEYDFTNSQSTSVAYGKFGEQGLTLPGHPMGLGVWVNGTDGNNHWLRAKIVDASGNVKLIDLARQVDWQGWKHVVGKFPSNLNYPIKLESIYLAETDTESFDKGVIYLDDLTLLMPVTEEDLAAAEREPLSTAIDVNQTQVIKGSLGEYLNVSFPKEGLIAEVLRISEEQSMDIATPGYIPILPAINIIGETVQADFVPEVAKPYNISVEYNETQDTGNLRLMMWDGDALHWVQIPQKIDQQNKEIKAKAEKFGLFVLMEDKKAVPVFNDISNSWASDQIEKMAAQRIVSGFPGGKFLPNKGVTRAEFVVLLSNLFGWSAEQPTNQFKDEIPSWAKESVTAAVSKGVVKGYKDGTFRPGKMITRAEMAAIINNYLGLEDSPDPSGYTDGDLIPQWAVQAIRNTKSAGLMRGNNNMFRPQDTASRAEATVVLDNMLNYYLR